LGYLRNVQDAEDVVQETTIKILQVLMEEEDKANQFRGESALKTWSYKIAINRAKDKIRQRNQQKRKGETLSIHETEYDNISDSVHPALQLESKEETDRIWKAINQLSERQKEALLLVKFDSFAVKEAAEIMEITPKAVESLLSRAKANLRKYLELKKQ